jgi:hypothetical protein
MLLLAILGPILFVTFIAMLYIIGLREGWKKVCKILGLCLLSLIFLILFIERFLGIEDKSTAFNIIGLLWWSLWTVGLIMYNIKEGYIGKF